MTLIQRQSIRNAITLNEHLGISADELTESGLLNTILGTDTNLFIDPKLLRDTEIPEFIGAMDDIEQYFSDLLAVNAQAKYPLARNKAISMIAIREPVGLSIGYGNSRNSGTSIPRIVAINALRAITELVAIGIEDEKVMEMLGLYIKGFGSDSISDLIAHIIYPRLCAFTETRSNRLSLNTYEYDRRGKIYNLPKQPNSGRPIILLPLSILSDLPLATSWEEIAAAASQNAATRAQFRTMIGSSISKYEKRIKSDPDLLIKSKDNIQLLMSVYDEAKKKSYDVVRDGKGYIRLANHAAKVRSGSPPEAVYLKTPSEMLNYIKSQIIERYRTDIEQMGANELLYKQTSKGHVLYDEPLHEQAAQTLFHILASHLTSNTDILTVRESKVGKASVDFFLASHPSNKILVEIKKSDNNGLLAGFDNQLKRYVEVEHAAGAIYLVVLIDHNNQSNRKSQLNQLKTLYADKIEKKQNCPELIIINGLEATSPSKLK